VLARVIGFRIPVLFGLAPPCWFDLNRRRRGVGYFGGWIDLGFQRFLEVWSACPRSTS
jgi:microcin C transport system permease protein